MLKKTTIFLISLMAATVVRAASYFQAPIDSMRFSSADVYVELDYGVLDQPGAGRNDSLRITLQQKQINEAIDSEGKYAVWQLLPDYVYLPEKEDGTLRVDIMLSDKSYMLEQDTARNADGFYPLKYKIDCSFRLTDRRSRTVLKDSSFTLCGIDASPVLRLSDNLSAASMLSLTKAVHRVRCEVFSQYGFGVFEIPSELKPVPCLPAADAIAGDIVSGLDAKKSMVPSAELMNLMESYSDIIAYNAGSCDAEGRKAAYYNLAFCSAWLRNEQAAAFALSELRSLRENFADSAAYDAISMFAEDYPRSANKYAGLMFRLGGDVYELTVFYAYNDIVSQVCDLPFIYNFLDASDYGDSIKAIRGSITPAAGTPVYYELSYADGHPSKLSVWREKAGSGSSKAKDKLNDLYLRYDKRGRFRSVATTPSRMVRVLMPLSASDRIDSLSIVSHVKTRNVLGAFVKWKTETVEDISFSIDPGGSGHVAGTTLSSHPLRLYSTVADTNDIQFPAAFSEFTTAFETLYEFSPDGFPAEFRWRGSALYEKNRGDYNYGYLKSDSISMSLERKADDSGEYYEYSFRADLSGNVGGELSCKHLNIYGPDYELSTYEKRDAENRRMRKAVYEGSYRWPISMLRGEDGEWLSAQIGPYRFVREFVYE